MSTATAVTLVPRMDNPVLMVPAALDGLRAAGEDAADTGVPHTTLEFVHLRASQINSCAVCVHMHARELRRLGESDERIDSVAAWREAPFYSEAERAALDLTEEVTRIADRGLREGMLLELMEADGALRSHLERP